MITRQAYNKDGQKIPFAIYEDDYVIETDSIREMAFMCDDEFPYFYCGEISSKKNNGQVQIYGMNAWLNPIFVVEYDLGIKIYDKGQELKQQRLKKVEKIYSIYQKKLEDM